MNIDSYSEYLAQNKSMGLFDLFKKKEQVQDPVLGTLTRDKFFWGGSTGFAPTRITIDIFVTTDRAPMEAHREFYRKIEAQYDLLRPKLQAAMLELFRNWQEDFEIKDFDQEFQVLSISFGDVSTTPVVWEIAFTNVYDDHMLTVTMRDMAPDADVQIDG